MRNTRSQAIRAAAGLLALLSASAVHAPARAQMAFSSGSTGADGPFAPTTTQAVQLPPSGVFNFTTVTIPTGVTITFKPNALNTPVTILATGDVEIDGTISVNGSDGAGTLTTINQRTQGGAGGPGGFRGGDGTGIGNAVDFGQTAGDGPGGGIARADHYGTGGGYAAMGTDSYGTLAGGAPYGSPTAQPLIGGSGGAGSLSEGPTDFGGAGGGGGGAVVIASSTRVAFNGGLISADGGAGGRASFTAGGGSGGAIRIVTNTLSGNLHLSARGGASDTEPGASGFVRIESFSIDNFSIAVNSPYLSVGQPSSVVMPAAPQLKIVSVDGTATPATPSGSQEGGPDVALPPGQTNPVTLQIQAANVPVGTVVNVELIPATGRASTVQSTPLAGSMASSTATASVTLTPGRTVATAMVSFAPPAGAGAQIQPLIVNGEKVDRVEVRSTARGKPDVTYVTRSGKRVTRQ